ncbi:titin [Tribolium castaneum]|uniref:PHD finger protein 10 n=1 Tax=Tribolium castaneum TaxID=7070 RepID=D2A2S2_TRICA|nr:PREDICTED: uncharacterized protein LOC656013 [Tribolium castaneum]EFA02772.1 hypothetical protein TcasGA2_TC008507 [Tribolium castaneum]|eukprot:XP_967662.3 PREDICTED: uncharacterized protein LOC656013 [Tribolium castaneum]
MESEKSTESELTSTMGNLLSSNTDEKSESCDSTPTSSTDAFTTTSTSHIAADDPISSTSSDALDSGKHPSSANPVINLVREMSGGGNPSPIASDKDLLDMNITDTSTEKITENVDDIVQDLENLLGEPTTSFDFTIRKDLRGANKDIAMELDEFSAELQMLQEKAVEPTTVESKEPSDSVTQSDIDNKINDSVEVSTENDLSELTPHISSTDPKIDANESTSILNEEKLGSLGIEQNVPQLDNEPKSVEENKNNDNISSKCDKEPEDEKQECLDIEQMVPQSGSEEVEKQVIEEEKQQSLDIEQRVSQIDSDPQSVEIIENKESAEEVEEKELKEEKQESLEVEQMVPQLYNEPQCVEEDVSSKSREQAEKKRMIEGGDSIVNISIASLAKIEENKETESDQVDQMTVVSEKLDEKTMEIGREVFKTAEDLKEKREGIKTIEEEKNMEIRCEDSKTVEDREVYNEGIKAIEEDKSMEIGSEDLKTVADTEVNCPEENVEGIKTIEGLKIMEIGNRDLRTVDDSEVNSSEEKSEDIKTNDEEKNMEIGRVENMFKGIEDSEVNTSQEKSMEIISEEQIGSKDLETGEASEAISPDEKSVETIGKRIITVGEEKSMEIIGEGIKTKEIGSKDLKTIEDSEVNSPKEKSLETIGKAIESVKEEKNMEIRSEDFKTVASEVNSPKEKSMNIVDEVINTVEDSEDNNPEVEFVAVAGGESNERTDEKNVEDETEETDLAPIDFIPEPKVMQAEEEPHLPTSSVSDLNVLDKSNVLPTAEEIFAEQDENLETLLAVASLGNVDYNMPPEEFVPEASPELTPFASKELDERIESLFIEKGLSKEQQGDKLKEPLVINVDDTEKHRVYSPKITIKAIKSPEETEEGSKGSLKMTITKQSDNTHSILKIYNPEEESQNQDEPTIPKLIIKPIVQPNEQPQSPKTSKSSKQVFSPSQRSSSPRITIKPIPEPLAPLKITIKPVERQKHSPKLTIKPIVEPVPKVTIKPVLKPQEKDEQIEKSSPKITIKPIVKPQELETTDEDDSVKERIVLKINKGTIPGSSKEEKLTKIKLKFSKEGGHPHIVQDDESPSKRQRIDSEMLPGVTITPITSQHSKLKEMLSRGVDKVVTIDDDDDDVAIVEETRKPSPIVISEESNQDSNNAMRDPMADIPIFEITPGSVKTMNPQPVVEEIVTVPTPRKRGRPRKVPLQVREDFKDPKEDEPPKVVVESTRPKRSCRGQSVRTTLGIKPRKPRGPGRGRGSKRGMGTRSTPTPPEMSPKGSKEPKLASAKEDLLLLSDKTEVKHIEIDEGFHKSPTQSLLAPPQDTSSSTSDRADIVMYEEETRMSAETSSRAQTPAKQVVTSIPSVDLIEESQSSVQSTATTESVKVRKGPRLEVHQEPEGAVISADQLAEYYWSGGGPYMLQEQVAQFLGIKSFKRKYPNIQRRVVDMQERDFIRESGLASEAMCDLGLTAVNTADILDIMYSDFQDKYEEYCKHQRDRQAKDLTNKQKALSLAAMQEKTKMDITQQAVQSAASWNSTFNKTRREQRKACMDLQTLTVHFPKGKMKQINKPKIGHYPVALVPGQFTDYYREFTPTEINNLPLNTMCYNTLIRGRHHEMECDSQTDGSGSESDTSTSDSDSSYSGSSDAEDCTLCKPTPKRLAAAL